MISNMINGCIIWHSCVEEDTSFVLVTPTPRNLLVRQMSASQLSYVIIFSGSSTGREEHLDKVTKLCFAYANIIYYISV